MYFWFPIIIGAAVVSILSATTDWGLWTIVGVALLVMGAVELIAYGVRRVRRVRDLGKAEHPEDK
ncbi:hypothetical protein ACI3EY_07700 [Ornithinimicrobium sp. LYQ92]|uniref:hypothetical protein n=1 Tax=Serinicoccus sp. LYQ92 TaxID=3378798 RepID=UPI003852211B